jgi:hypothetical protein
VSAVPHVCEVKRCKSQARQRLKQEFDWGECKRWGDVAFVPKVAADKISRSLHDHALTRRHTCDTRAVMIEGEALRQAEIIC